MSISPNLIFGVIQESILETLLLLLHLNDLPQVVFSDSLPYDDDDCIVFKHSNITEIEKQLLRDFSAFCDRFVDNKLSIHFGQDKLKSILFST